jgi:uncharacterized protein (TIGR03435 family)
MRRMRLATGGVATVGALVVVSSLSAPRLGAQAATAGGPVFEAASVKPNRSGDLRWDLEPQPGGRLTATNATAAKLVRFAYDLPDFIDLVFGGPPWLDSERFDVVTKADGDAPLAEIRLMTRALLKERFKLVAHKETRVLPIYALVRARSDGRLGGQIRPTGFDCTGVPPPPPGRAGFIDAGVRCGVFGFAPGTSLPSGRGGLAFRGVTMETFAKLLVPMVRRPVSDQTKLTGFFDGEFDLVAEGPPPPPPPPGMPDPFDRSFQTIFTALPEQLGLKLDSRRGPVDVLVIDRVEQPTAD